MKCQLIFLANIFTYCFSQLLSYNEVLDTHLACDQKNYYFQINFKYPFYGTIESQTSGLTDCVLVDGQKLARQSYNLSIDLNSCGSTHLFTPQFSEYSVQLLVKHPPEQTIKYGDNSYELVCRFNPSLNVTVFASSNVKIFGPESQELRQTVQLGGQGPVHFDNHLVFGHDLTGPVVNRTVRLGERLTYVFRCDIGNGSAGDCAVGECYATGTASYDRVQLSDADGCSFFPKFWGHFSERPSARKTERIFSTSYWAWSLHSDENIVISCRLRVCPQLCDRQTCPKIASEAQNGLDRKRSKPQQEALVALSVEMPQKADDSTYSKSSTDSNVCISRSGLGLLLALWLGTLLILTVVIFVLGWRLQQLGSALYLV